MPILLSITCLCGALSQTLTARPSHAGDGSSSSHQPIPITLCHCNTCRRTSGVLCTSYCPVEAPAWRPGEAPLTPYTSSLGTTRYFCRTCGCHVFRSRQQPQHQQKQQQKQQLGEDHGGSGQQEALLWEVATGVIVDERYDGSGDGHGKTENEDDGGRSSRPRGPVLVYARHDHVADTGDGGLAVWLSSVDGQPMTGIQSDTLRLADPPSVEPGGLERPKDRTVSAACHCGAVQFAVRPPDHDLEASRRPHSGFPDLLVPFAATDPSITANPEDAKWWLRPKAGSSGDPAASPTRYLAGTCACRSCRLSSGFEIQTWAFVPRTNIILLPSERTLDFTAMNTDGALRLLATYQSSPDVERNFCARCGATVFWHDVWRPDLIDVSVGLLQQPRSSHPGSSSRSSSGLASDTSSRGTGNGSSASQLGLRVESLLDWCTTRVSFVEEASHGRRGLSAQRGSSLVGSLEAGMKKAPVIEEA